MSSYRHLNLPICPPGPEINERAFVTLMYPRIDVPTVFRYPEERLLELRGILSATEMKTPNGKTFEGEDVRYVFKRGLTTQTTVGRLTGFESTLRHYGVLGSWDTVEAAIYPYNVDSGAFSEGGDSGAVIVDGLGEFVGLLTGGVGASESSDITYCSPMFWIWQLIKTEFPSANLYFDNWFVFSFCIILSLTAYWLLVQMDALTGEPLLRLSLSPLPHSFFVSNQKP